MKQKLSNGLRVWIAFGTGIAITRVIINIETTLIRVLSLIIAIVIVFCLASVEKKRRRNK